MNKDEILIGYEVGTGYPVTTTVDDIRKNKILFEGDSGSGKSHEFTVFIEGTDKKAQRLIIDIEGEYFPLKNHFEFLLFGKSTDDVKVDVELNLNDVYVEKLAVKLLESSADTIIDLSEYPTEAPHFVSVLFKALLKHAKKMKRPLLIFVDEAHVFAPEKGTGSEDSLKAVIEMAKRGRKRGIGLLCATQAMADFSKNVVRQLRTRFIGNCTLEGDVKAAARVLGFDKKREKELSDLGDDHHFFVAGKAIKINGKKPKHMPKIKGIGTKTTLHSFEFNKVTKIKETSPNAIRQFKEEFSDIPELIDSELSKQELLEKENIEYKKTIQEQKNTITQLQQIQPKNDPKESIRQYQKGYSDGIREIKPKFEKQINELKSTLRSFKPIINRLCSIGKELSKYNEMIPEIDKILELKIDKTKLEKQPTIISESKNITKNTSHKEPTSVDGIELSGPETKILTAIVQRPDHSGTRSQISLMSGYSIKSSGFTNPLGHLRKLGLITYGPNTLTATDRGIDALGDYTPLSTDSKTICQYWLSKVTGPERRILEPIIEVYPEIITREDCAQKAGYSVTSSGFTNPLGHLRKIGLIEYISKDLKATKELFPDY